MSTKKKPARNRSHSHSKDDLLTGGQLLQFAKFALTMDGKNYPANTDNTFKDEMEAAKHEDRLKTTVNYIQRELARLGRSQKSAARKRPAKKSAPKKAAKKAAPKKAAAKKSSPKKKTSSK